MTNRLLTSAAIVILVLAYAAACQPEDSAYAANDNADPLWNGKQHYQEYCQTCHGATGAGDGAIAELLKVPPPDLSLITIENGGNFPADKLTAWIDGRQSAASHGLREMPVWGNIWTDQEGGIDAEQGVARQISELVEYIRTLQVDEPSA